MVYYIKEGQSSIFKNVKINKNECKIPPTTSNIKRMKKIGSKLKKKKIEQVVLSRKIKNGKEFIEILNNYDITIFDGKWFMQYLLKDIIDYTKKKMRITNDDEISILANDLNNEVKQNIKKFANTYKKIRVVTNHLEKFEKLENEMYEENGTSIIITNNRRKALAKSVLIINFDFVQETINQYNIAENAIIINLNDKIKINKKRFCGTIITDYEVEIQNADKQNELKLLEDVLKKQEEFSLKEILEEKIYSVTEKQPNFKKFQMIENIIKKYNIKIKEVHVLNGILS